MTPYLVKPSNSRIAEPTDGYIPPNDKDLYVGARNFRPTLGDAAPEKDGRDVAATMQAEDVKLVGPAGFILE